MAIKDRILLFQQKEYFLYIQIEISHYQRYFIGKICILKWSYIAFLNQLLYGQEKISLSPGIGCQSRARTITQRTNCLWVARYSLGHSRSTPVVPTVPVPSIHDHRFMMYSCHVIQTRFKPSPLNQFLNSPPIRFKPGSQKALLHLIQVQFFEWSCLFWWPNLVIQAVYTSTESLRGFYSYLWWGDQMHSYKTLNLCEKRHSNFNTVFKLSLKIHKD